MVEGMYTGHHAKFQVIRLKTEFFLFIRSDFSRSFSEFLALSPNPACFVRTAAIIMQLGMAVAVVLPYNRAKLQANRSTTREAIPFLALSPNPSPI